MHTLHRDGAAAVKESPRGPTDLVLRATIIGKHGDSHEVQYVWNPHAPGLLCSARATPAGGGIGQPCLPPLAPSLESTRFASADRNVETILHVPALGRYTLTARSALGASVELVDRMAGTIATAAPGDGGAPAITRLDSFLKPGDYKVRISKQASGDGGPGGDQVRHGKRGPRGDGGAGPCRRPERRRRAP